MSKKDKQNKKNPAVGDKIAMAIFSRAVPALIERWKRYNDENESSKVTFDEFLVDIMNEYDMKGGKNMGLQLLKLQSF